MVIKTGEIVESKKPCVLITGVSGFIGKEFFNQIKHLNPVGIKFSSKSRFSSKNIIKVDLRDRNQVNDLFNKYKPDIVYHFAALTSPAVNEENVELARKIHIRITQNILENMSDRVHLIYLSTDKVFDGSDPNPNEKSPTNPLWTYGQFKLSCENMIKERARKYHILRLPIVHSIGDINSNSFIDEALIQIKKGKTVKVYNNVFRCYILLSDLINLLSKLTYDNNYDIYHIGTEMMSYYERLRDTCIKNGIKYKSLLKPVSGSANPMRQNLDTKKIKDIFKCEFR